jgi:N-acetylneuraminic acid mutarotase
MPAAEYAAAAAAINGIIYVAGGEGSNLHETPTLQAYNAATNTWTTLADMPAGRYAGDGAAVINGQLYVPGGWDNTYSRLPHPELFVYEPGTNTWASRASMPHLSAGGVSGAINGKLYVTTPDNGYSGYRNFLDVYDPVSDSWSSLAPTPHVYQNPAGGVIGGKLYLASGYDGSSWTNVLDVYDPATDTWTAKAPMPTAAVAQAAGAVIGGKLYVVGGRDAAGNAIGTVELYDPATDSWSSEPAMPTARIGLAAGVVNGVLYAVGGGNASAILATNEAFTPGADIVVDSVKTQDSKTLTVNYDVNVPNLNQPFDIDIFRYSQAQFDVSLTKDLIADIKIQTSSYETVGRHEVPVTLKEGLPPDPLMPYVLAVADPYQQLLNVTTDSSAGHFHVYVIGAVVPGFAPFAWGGTPTPDTWVQTMADSLMADGYYSAIAFAWASGKWDGSALDQAATNLYQEIFIAAQGIPNLETNDVIDIHLIGHSRGAVVIGRTMAQLIASPPNDQLSHGFMEMTLLDPHPANNAYGLNADFTFNGALTVAPLYLGFQAIVADGPVIVPSRVNLAEDIYQSTNANQGQSYPIEATVVNLHGLPRNGIQIQGPDTIVAALALTGYGMGHSEIHDWYQYLIKLLPESILSLPTPLQVTYVVHSPVGLLIVDPQGRRLGYDPISGARVNDFGPLATDSGINSEPEVLAISMGSVLPGPYQVTAVGTGSGPYHIELRITSEDNPLQPIFDQIIASGIASPGQTIAPVPPMDIEQIAHSATMTLVTSDHPSGSVYGQTVTFTATVASDLGDGTPSGSVQFQIDNTNFGSPVTLSNGIATIVAMGLNAGYHSVAGVYASDTSSFLPSSASITFQVTPAPLTISADNQTKVYGDPLPTLTASYTGFVNGDTSGSLTVSPSVTTTATASSDVVPGGYPITAGGAIDPNYTITYVAATLTIIPANQTITWSNPGHIIYGTALSSSQLNAAVSVVGPAPAGTLTYNPAAGTILGPGSGQILSVTAAATNDYNSATATVSINVVYNFSGFLPPLNNTNSFELGRTIPIKFQLSDVNDNLITTLAAVSSLQGQALDVNGNPVGSPFTLSSSGNSELRNDGTQYIFNWQTKGLAAGSYEILLSLNDGTVNTKVVNLSAAGAAASGAGIHLFGPVSSGLPSASVTGFPQQADSFATRQAALNAVLAEWTSQDDYATRIANLLGTGSGSNFNNRLNEKYFLQPGVTVFDDGAQDQLTGSAGQDWFFANIFDTRPGHSCRVAGGVGHSQF